MTIVEMIFKTSFKDYRSSHLSLVVTKAVPSCRSRPGEAELHQSCQTRVQVTQGECLLGGIHLPFDLFLRIHPLCYSRMNLTLQRAETGFCPRIEQQHKRTRLRRCGRERQQTDDIWDLARHHSALCTCEERDLLRFHIYLS